MTVKEVRTDKEISLVQLGLIIAYAGFLVSDVLTVFIYAIAYFDSLQSVGQLNIANVRNLLKNGAVTSFLWLFYIVSKEKR